VFSAQGTAPAMLSHGGFYLRGAFVGLALPAAGPWVSWIGWIATAAFGVSYFARTPKALRIVQACAALLWIAYGFIIHAMPVVVANAIVAGAAVYSSFAPPKAAASQPPPQF
jgi:hypothetical protein